MLLPPPHGLPHWTMGQGESGSGEVIAGSNVPMGLGGWAHRHSLSASLVPHSSAQWMLQRRSLGN